MECHSFIGVDCLSFQSPAPLHVQSVEKFECAPQKFSRAWRAPLPFINYSCRTPPLAKILHPPLQPCLLRARGRPPHHAGSGQAGQGGSGHAGEGGSTAGGGGGSAAGSGGGSAAGGGGAGGAGVTGKSVARKLCRGDSFSLGNYVAHN